MTQDTGVNLLFARVCIEHPLDMGKLGEVWHCMLRRLEDRIRYICWKALTARDDELGSLFWELRSALHEHANRLRQLAAPKFAIAKEACYRRGVRAQPIAMTEEKRLGGLHDQ